MNAIEDGTEHDFSPVLSPNYIVYIYVCKAVVSDGAIVGCLTG